MAGPGSRLQLVGRPENVTASTSTALAQRPRGPLVCFDVNGYYAALGVHWRVSRAELAAAYRARGGESDPHLTYAFRHLLDRRSRAAYDARLPGALHADPAIRAELARRAATRATQENTLYGTNKNVADILFSALGDSTPACPGFLDTEESGRFDEPGSRDRQPPPNSPAASWSYAYLRLDSTCADTGRIAQWQEGLSRHLANRTDLPQFAVGYHGTPGQPFLVMRLAGTPVFFLHEDADATGELIAAAATAAFE